MAFSADHALVLFGAGLLAGTVGSAGGITSLVSYPALLAVGITPLRANVTNAVALVASWPGSALGSRPELRGSGAQLARWLPVAAVGGALGATLLLRTPETVFARVVPFLVALGAATLFAQPQLARLRDRYAHLGGRVVFAGGLLAISVYDGYFGAGSGIMLLSLLLLTRERAIARANALKNMLLGASDLACAIGFSIFGHVIWSASLPLAIGLLGGGTLGPSLTRRLPPDLLRVLVGLAGLGLAIKLFVSPT